ncbi:MAG: hypothetical protein R3C11_08925 [Planctomycetaceae bacterium]
MFDLGEELDEDDEPVEIALEDDETLDLDDEDMAGDFLSEFDDEEDPVMVDVAESSEAIVIDESDSEINIEDSAQINIEDSAEIVIDMDADEDDDDEPVMIVEDSATDLLDEDDYSTGSEIPAYQPEKGEGDASLETIAELDLNEAEEGLEKTEAMFALEDDEAETGTIEVDEEEAAQNFLNSLEDEDDLLADGENSLDLEEDDEIDFSFFDDDDEEDEKA